MNVISGIFIILHPIAALILIWAFMRQRRWRQNKLFLQEQTYETSLERHRLNGNRLMLATLFVVLLAFMAEIIRAWYDNIPIHSYMIPTNFHASGGLLGVILMFILWRSGHSTNSYNIQTDSYSRTKNLHGRIGDIMSILIIIHAFLGFLYLLQII